MDLSLMKRIGEALELDSCNKYQEAYVKYVECILSVANNLLHNFKVLGGRLTTTTEAFRYIQLGQQSFDRVAALLKIISDNSLVSSHPTHKLSDPVPPLQEDASSHRFALDKKKTLSPMEVAYKQNQQLMTAYRARMSSINKRDSASLSLTIQRKMAENLAIAKAQEEALAKKMKERQLRLEEQAARRFTAPIGMSDEEQEQRQIYKKILEYEQEAKWLAEWRDKLNNNPLDTIVINQLIQEIIRCVDHPLTQLLKNYQFKVYEKLYPLVCRKADTVKDIVVPLPKYLHPAQTKEKNSQDDQQNGNTENVIENSSIDQTQGKDVIQSTEENISSKNNYILPSQKTFSGEDAENESQLEYEDTVVSISASKLSSQDLSVEHCSEESQEQSNAQHADTVESNSGSLSSPSKTVDESIWKQLNDSNPGQAGDESNLKKLKDTNPSQAEDESNLKKPEMTNSSQAGDEVKLKKMKTTDPSEASDLESRCETNPVDIADMCEQTNRDVQLALEKGEKLKKQLTIEMEKSKSVVLNFSKDYEMYNQENMDDLFDDDDDDDDDDDEIHNTGFGQDDNSDKDDDGVDARCSDILKHDQADNQQTNISFSISRSQSMRQLEENPSSLTRSFKSLDLSSASSRHSSYSKSIPSISDAELGKMSEDANHRHLKSISEDVHSYMEKLLVMFTIAYENLDSPTGRDQCYASLEEVFFKSLWKYLLTLYRFANKSKEVILAYHMTVQQDWTPSSFGVIDKLCLLPDDGGDQVPYASAIEELCRVKEHYTMLSKLECVVRVCRLVILCVEDYYAAYQHSTKKSPNVGADDLLPILSYIVIKSCLPQLVSECSAMSEFIHEGYIMGEEGYCLTSLETAILHCCTDEQTLR